MSDLLEIFAVDEKQSREFSTVLADKNGVHPTLLTAKMRLYNADLESDDSAFIINARDGASGANANVLQAGGCTYDSGTGLFTWNITAADTTIADQNTTTVLYIAEVEYTYGVKNGGFRVGLRVTNWLAGGLTLCDRNDVLRHPSMKAERDSLVEDTAVTEHIENLIAAVSGHVEKRTDRVLRRKTYTHTLDVEPGSRSIRLRGYPIVSIASIKESSTGDFAGTTAKDTSEWAMLDEGRFGEVGLRAGCFVGGIASVQVEYRGGIASRVELVDPTTRYAVADQVAFMFRRGTKVELASEGQPQGSASFLVAKDYTPLFAMALASLMPPGIA